MIKQLPELTAQQYQDTHLTLCNHALRQWQVFCENVGDISYYESIAGTQQWLDMQLPFDAMNAVKFQREAQGIKQRYQEPIAGLQDDDLELPADALNAYLAIYNFFRKYALAININNDLIVNQACASQQRFLPKQLQAIAIKKALRYIED